MVWVPFLNHHQYVFIAFCCTLTRLQRKKTKTSVACETLTDLLLRRVTLLGVWMQKPQRRAAKDEENNISMQQQQQASASQIRALGALCRVLSQVCRGRIGSAIPRLYKVWTKYAANLFLRRIRCVCGGGGRGGGDACALFFLPPFCFQNGLWGFYFSVSSAL